MAPSSGETWKLHDLGKASIERYGYPYLTVYRPDLLGVLERAVRREKPNAIRLGAKCVGFEQTVESVTLRLEDGKGVVSGGLASPRRPFLEQCLRLPQVIRGELDSNRFRPGSQADG